MVDSGNLDSLLLQVKARAQKHFQKAVGIRRHLHAHPELSFQEYQTRDFLFEQLIQSGFQQIQPLVLIIVTMQITLVKIT